MKRFIIQTTIVLGSLFVITGCGSSDSDKKELVTKSSSSVSIGDKKALFDKRMDSFKDSGFEVQTVSDSSDKSLYQLNIKNAKLAASTLLGLVNMATLAPRDQKSVADAIAGAKVGLEVDWAKYAQNSDNSVFAYFMGNGKESGPIKKLIDEKKIAAYLTFVDDGGMSKVIFRDIDEKMAVGHDTVHISLRGAKIDINNPTIKPQEEKDFVISGGELKYEVESNGTEELVFSYSNPRCTNKQSNSYLGKLECKFPKINIIGKSRRNAMNTMITDLNLKYETTLHDKKIKANLLFAMPKINIAVKDNGDDVDIHLKGFEISGFSDNIKESTIKELYTLASNPPKDVNVTFEKSMKLTGELFSKGLVFDYKIALDSLSGKSVDRSKITTFNMEELLGKMKATFDENINYREKTTIKHIVVQEQKASTPIFEIKGIKFGDEVKDMYNFIPSFMQFAMKSAQNRQNGVLMSKEDEKMIEGIGAKIVNNGFGFSLSPIGIDSLSTNMMGKSVNYGKVDLNIDAQLSQNSVKLTSPMSMMALLGFLEADGKLVLSKSDLEQMSSQFPPQVIAMVMMYAKYEGDQAVFILKFENGHLTVNSKPVM